MRIVDGWYVNVLIGRTWGFDWISILFIIVSILSFGAGYNIKKPLGYVFIMYFLGMFCLVFACHCKPVEKIVTEYKIECDDTAKVNNFFNRFELQKVVDETHYIVRQKDWEDFD